MDVEKLRDDVRTHKAETGTCQKVRTVMMMTVIMTTRD